MKAVKQSFKVAFKVSSTTILRNHSNIFGMSWGVIFEGQGVQMTPRHPAVLNPIDNWHLYLSYERNWELG